jgi:DNA-binding MarR family transcriptional regulator
VLSWNNQNATGARTNRGALQVGERKQELAAKLGMYASRLVAVVDDLEQRGVIERHPSNTDRRVYALHLAKSRREQLSAIGAIAREHGRDLFDGLSNEDRSTLTATIHLQSLVESIKASLTSHL